MKSPNQAVIGCIILELASNHLSFGEKIPVFSNLLTDSEEICHDLLHLVQFIAS